MLFDNLAILAVGFLVLVKSSEICVRSLASIARYFCLSEFAISFLIVGIASVLPELTMGSAAALEGSPDMGVAVILGSNIADLTLILGLVALYAGGLKVQSGIRRSNGTLLLLVALPIVLFLIDGTLSQLEGVILVVAYVYYMRKVIGRNKGRLWQALCRIGNNRADFIRHTAIAAISLCALFISASMVSDSGLAVAAELGFPTVVMGILLALGTCAPEFTLAIQAIRKGSSELGVGDLIGNVATDATLSLGIVAIMSPVAPQFQPVAISGIAMVAAAALAVHFMRTGRKVSAKEGVTLVFAYLAFIALEFAVQAKLVG